MPHAQDVIADVAIGVAPNGKPPFHGPHPQGIAVAGVPVHAAEPCRPAELEELGVARSADAAVEAESEARVRHVTHAAGHALNEGEFTLRSSEIALAVIEGGAILAIEPNLVSRLRVPVGRQINA